MRWLEIDGNVLAVADVHPLADVPDVAHVLNCAGFDEYSNIRV